ncbi:hypothetical protein LPTSP4_21350 [Leptospira ryugenii]|uniref:DUF4430 domain-containing protein n=1 Tax=Leptospira ryugenii TaxID=1917863 RepID=A0A2P2E164_9LEPT|nr:hypothetical protein [Leptospira ryugenii]GBF50609.1 hypothetical protein LPTSP4_21350 [Leptospira ryugenii]
MKFQTLLHLVKVIAYTKVLFVFLFCTASPSQRRVESASDIQIQFQSSEYEETKRISVPPWESRDLLLLLAELSKKEDPSLRFISTNRTEEIMEVNGLRNSWKEGWTIYLNDQKIMGTDLKKGIRVSPKDKILIRYESVQRVFGKPIEED